jgi:hypothetical protein
MTLWWKQVWCPYCQAPPGEHCVSKNGKPVATHVDRHAEGAYAIFSGYDYEDDDEYHPDMEYDAAPSRPMVTVYLPGDAPAMSDERYYRMLNEEARKTPSVAEMDRAYFEADHRRLEGT